MKYMKRRFLFAAALLSLLLAFLGGCAIVNTAGGVRDLTLEEIADKLCDNVDVPPYEVIPLDQTTFEYYSFVPYDDSLSAVAADALVNITPHSMVVIRAEKGNGTDIANTAIQNADPNKWLCVGSETVHVAYTDHYVLLVMSDKATTEGIVENFKGMAKDLDGMSITVLSAENSRYEW